MLLQQPLSGQDGTVLLFGPQALAYTPSMFNDLRAAVWGKEEWSWLIDTISSLLDCWDAFATQFPQFKAVDGKKQLQELHESFKTGVMAAAGEPLPNIVLSPLVVIGHMVDYIRYRQNNPHHITGALGFCTGLLSAFAVALSKDDADLQTYGANAIRLAVLIGGIVDGQDSANPHGPSVALATAWNSENEGEFQRILKNHPDAYISVAFDNNRVTVTTATRSADALQKELRNAGILAPKIGLRGRFHHESLSEVIESISRYCDGNPNLALPHASALAHPTQSNSSKALEANVALHTHALRATLAERSEWYRTFQLASESWMIGNNGKILAFGPERCVPPSMAPKFGSRVSQISENKAALLDSRPQPRKADDIAVVGMSIKVAGADDLDEFWDLLCEGKSQHKEVPSERFGFDQVWREKDTTNRKWFGNFINHHDTFDHKFFKKSAREISSTDPQQRQMLQVVYQAVEQSGYFGRANPDKKIGCYIGVCSADYENNVACYEPNAFTAIGNLKSFIAGKISHWFGWTGPGLCIDTACSSSLVAVHQACQSILSGETTAALAGGANIMAHSLWFQNLAAASFLSPTGQCKPFDQHADGYCRGEGFAAVFLKKMSTAIEDGDQIFGTISSTGVLQNQNCTPVFVPNSPSLTELFSQTLARAHISPEQIGYAEAHGTGTQVGDPAEYSSILNVMGGSNRSRPLYFGSVKGLVGHTECASGTISLIKSLLMIQNRAMPPQASHTTLNSALHASPNDKMELVTRLKPWEDDSRNILINNYGASGSNASMVVTEAPRCRPRAPESSQSAVEYPIRLVGTDDRALKEYITRFRRFLNSKSGSLSYPSLAFNVSRQSNPTLDKVLAFSARSTEDVIQKLLAFEEGKGDVSTYSQQNARPVIMAFGGQVSTFVGLDPAVYQNASVFRRHLDECDSVVRSLGRGSIFPGIFQRSPVANALELQPMLFAMQYSCALSWIDCGVTPVAVVGHSFGELVAMCVSGTLSLYDAMKMTVGRAAAIVETWGEDGGSMIAIEADLEVVQKLLQKSNSRSNEAGAGSANIACFNGAQSFTVAGSTKSIDIVVETLQQDAEFSTLRNKRLNVTNAFHSALVDPLVPKLAEMGQELSFQSPSIYFEMSTESATRSRLGPSYVADHMRDPVYFHHAVQRLARLYPSAVWIEAGSNSTITGMASRSLNGPKTSHFQAVNITADNALQQLTKVTLELWKQGLKLVHWSHHRSQTYEYDVCYLPPYQFEKARHWLDLKPAPKIIDESATREVAVQQTPEGLWSFVAYTDDKKQSGRFRINTMNHKYKEMVSGHIIAQTAPICPATVEVNIAVEALLSIQPTESVDKLQPRIESVTNEAPICEDLTRSVWLDLEVIGQNTWGWKMTSDTPSKPMTTLHVSGKIILTSKDDPVGRSEFADFERLVGHQHCVEILNSTDADDIIQGRNIYSAFNPVVDYAEPYRGVQRVVGKNQESAGRVLKKHNGETWLDAHLADCFSQVGGIWVNCMTDCKLEDMYIAIGFEKWIRSPSFSIDSNPSGVWDVLAKHHRKSEKDYVSDILIFDANTGALSEIILGINYHKVPKASMSKMLTKLTNMPGVEAKDLPARKPATEIPIAQVIPTPQASPAEKSKSEEKKGGNGSVLNEICDKIRGLLAEISGLKPEEIKDNTDLADIGIDSLMGMELSRELGGMFKTDLPTDELYSVTDFRSLVACVTGALGMDVAIVSDDNSSTTDGDTPYENSMSSHSSVVDEKESHDKAVGELQLPSSAVRDAFQETKDLTDQFIKDYRCADYMKTVLPFQNELCVALVVEAFEKSGRSLTLAKAGDILPRISHAREHGRLTDYLYQMLEQEAHLVQLHGSKITRTSTPVPTKSSRVILNELLAAFPDHTWANKLTYFAGGQLAEVLRGDVDGIKLIFGSAEGRELVTGLYGDSLLNKLANVQMQDMLSRLISKIYTFDGPLRILELGAGTGGTTTGMIEALSKLNVPIEYTFTDLSGSFVALARKKYAQYPFMKFRVHDIEKPPASDLVGTQHVVLGSNAIHATRSLTVSVTNVKKMLRPDGFLMMLEMTQPLYWVDLIFGLFEGWWLFEDNRQHAIAPESQWERELQNAGYGHVDWTDGKRPEVAIQKVIMAFASGPRYERTSPVPASLPAPVTDVDPARKAKIEEYVSRYSQGFQAPNPIRGSTSAHVNCTIAITGATGSLGVNLVAHLAALPEVDQVICINRRSTTGEPDERQRNALETRGISLDATSMSKLRCFQTDTAKPYLGLPQETYDELTKTVTHLIHNAWPMTGKRPVAGLEAQFKVVRNLVDFASDAASQRPRGFKFSFQFISSIAVIGHYPERLVPEKRMELSSVLPNGYGEAKFICENVLDNTLHRFPDSFRIMSVRLGQIAGSKTNGYWNSVEHLPFLIKSSQTLNALPAFKGDLCWTPVDDVAGTLSDLVLRTGTPYPIYHIDNPVRQPWEKMIPDLAEQLGVPRGNLLPFNEWIGRVRDFDGPAEDNPAAKLVDFLDDNFLRMSCGGLLLDTAKSCEHSPTLAAVGPVGVDVMKKYVAWWKRDRFLRA
ncbi:Polyketide synthase [Tolypocladium capitatum]|uniref:Polyketide synthase n=1 Tax=Tolypocladium capitatum TaxID=45235 RepID=A0A2K3QPG7_9HYPO|nr:Polyketide synthase [Tolypocladium capitatum]